MLLPHWMPARTILSVSHSVRYLRNEPGVGYRLALERGDDPGGPLGDDRQPRVGEGGHSTTPLEGTSESIMQAGLAVHRS